MKQCPTCEQMLAHSSFYADKRRPDGLKAQCKGCHNESSVRTRDPKKKRIANRLSARRLRSRDPQRFRARERASVRAVDEKVHARRKLNSAVRRGKLPRPSNCSRCGEAGKVTGHHHDYSKPLDVTWLCYVCHAEEDKRRG